jgi:hypothetical protein
LSEFGVVSGWDWNDFSDVIKHKNRFHNNLFNPEIMAPFLATPLKSMTLIFFVIAPVDVITERD